MARSIGRGRRLLLAAFVSGLICVATTAPAVAATGAIVADVGPIRIGPSGGRLQAILDDWYRIDIARIEVAYDLFPDEARAVGTARIVFEMRPGEERAVFHFAPRVGGRPVRQLLQSVRLDGELVDHRDPQQLRRLRHPDSRQIAFELTSPVGAGRHVMEIGWELTGWAAFMRPGWFHARVDDTAGIGGDALWPTVNAPDELAAHTVELRVHDDRRYVAIGSAPVTTLPERGDGVQRFGLRTDRAVPSIGVFVAAVPAAEVRVRSFEVDGVPVTIVSDQPRATIASAERVVAQTLPRLVDDFGPYPAPSLAVLLVRWADGMEYHGATRTGLSSLRHELVHMWWGMASAGKTWRDIWMDEAITVWWDERVPPIPDGFVGDLVSGRPVVATGFDLRAYGRGAAMIARIAGEVGGDQALIDILGDIHRRRAFAPFTTLEFIDDLDAAVPTARLRPLMLDWLYRVEHDG